MDARSRTLKLAAVATVAVTALAGGVAWADGSSDDGGNSGGRAADAAGRPTSAATAPKVLTAQVSSDDTLVRGRGAKKVVDGGTGTYRVRFNRPVAGCVFTGSLTDDSTGFGAVGFISLATDGASPRGVFVETRNSSGNLTDSDFSLVVVC